jgi:capsular polysaccharide biosynthesis protein
MNVKKNDKMYDLTLHIYICMIFKLEVVSDADVVMSLHGAGLINGIFAKSGMVLVELHGGYGADDGVCVCVGVVKVLVSYNY